MMARDSLERHHAKIRLEGRLNISSKMLCDKIFIRKIDVLDLHFLIYLKQVMPFKDTLIHPLSLSVIWRVYPCSG